ncbi:MAG: hypothetical protein Kow0092_30500 [Deferrisomatales bacterium]
MKRFVTAALAALFWLTPARAATIVDTGPGTVGLGGYSLNSGQWAAGKFSITEPYEVTDAAGWVYVASGSAASVAIYSDGGTKPGSVLFSAPFASVPAPSETGWAEATGLAWDLSPGVYWVALEVHTGQDLAGSMPYTTGTPLAAYVLGRTSWTSYDVKAGLRLRGNPANPVPEPATLALVGTGLAWLAASRRRPRHRQIP